jgi:predicted dehydrogenase
MDKLITRRQFVASSLAAGTVLALAPGRALGAVVSSPGKKVVLAIAGVRTGAPLDNGRGIGLIEEFAALPNVEFKYVIDVDKRSLATAAALTEKAQGRAPKMETDFRRALDDKDVDAFVIATPDHWHAPMAILGAKAGKHIYVEKPCSLAPHENEMMVDAAKKYKRLMQVGSQRRSIENVRRMVGEIQGGVIGNVFLAQCFYGRRRAPIGFGKRGLPPAELNWDLWQGPALRMPYRDNIHPYNWHWFWRWGSGEAGNNGVHLIDVARWAMNVSFPTKVSSFGGRWQNVGIDDWETPDTQELQFEFGPGRGLSWFGRSHSSFGKSYGIIFFGSKGTLDYDGGGSYTVYDLDDKPVKKIEEADPGYRIPIIPPVPRLNDHHVKNFIEAIRGDSKLNAPIKECFASTLLTQLGNIAHRTGHTLNINPANGHILGDAEAAKLWTAEYEPGWEPKV